MSYHAIQGEGPNGSAAQLSFVLTPRWEPDFSDDPIFDGLDRDTAIELGVRGVYERGLFFVEGEALADVSDTHNGYEASAFVGLQYEAGAFSLEGGFANALETVPSVTVPILFAQVERDQYTFNTATGQNDIQEIIDASTTESEIIWIGPEHPNAFGSGLRFDGYQYFNQHPEQLLDFMSGKFG